jgi:hypothetical protein
MGIVGIVGYAYMRDWNWAVAFATAQTKIYETGRNYTLSVVPLFILMGNFVTRAGMSKELYRAGHTVVGYDRSAEAMRAFEGRASEDALRAPRIVLAVFDSADAEQVVAASSASLYVDCTTGDPARVEALARGLARKGIRYVEAWLRGRDLKDEVSWGMAWAVGFGQLVAAAFPGTSRSGVTILLCLILGLNRPAATEFCFLVGIPTMLAAGAWEIRKSLHHHSGAATQENWAMVGLGFVVAAVVSFVAVKWLLRYVQTHTFVAFGWYRIGLAVVIGILLLRGMHAS